MLLLQNWCLDDSQLLNLTLIEIEKYLKLNCRYLIDFKPIVGNKLIYNERSYNERSYVGILNSMDRSKIHDNNIIKVLTSQFLSSLRTSGLSNHHITSKVGTPIMLMRNINQSEGLCNGTRLIVTKLGNHIIETQMMGGKGDDKIIYIPMMDMSPSQSPWSFKLNRWEFLIIVCYSVPLTNRKIKVWIGLVSIFPQMSLVMDKSIILSLSVTGKKRVNILVRDEKNIVKTSTINDEC